MAARVEAATYLCVSRLTLITSHRLPGGKQSQKVVEGMDETSLPPDKYVSKWVYVEVITLALSHL
jgi:hypothetical protein